mmetsp:Transcript_150/g.302  ORF Transcript_150/g.302 Transcript_150/m.302 type:complete len:213 (-) Transcript_150:164-802(-)
MPRPLNFSEMVEDMDSEGNLWEEPAIFSGFPGYLFGDHDHFDIGCDADVSIQYMGIKRWSLWSPVELVSDGGEVIEALTRFETTLNPKDALFKSPGWFHNTTILEHGGESIASVYIFTEPPPYGNIDPKVWENNPFGFGFCAFHEEFGWAKRAQMWHRLMEQPMKKDGEHRSSSSRRRASSDRMHHHDHRPSQRRRRRGETHPQQHQPKTEL